MGPDRGEPLHCWRPAHFVLCPFEDTKPRAKNTPLLLDAAARWYVRKQRQYNSIREYHKLTAGLSSLVSSSVMMWLCVFLIRARAPVSAVERRKRRGRRREGESIGPFNSMHTGLISFRAHYRAERGFSISRKMQVMRHLKYSTTLG